MIIYKCLEDINWIKKALKATDDIITKYKNGDKIADDDDTCAYCNLGLYYRNKGLFRNRCNACPWTIFTGEDCFNGEFTKVPIKNRLFRLNGWKKRFKNRLVKLEADNESR